MRNKLLAHWAKYDDAWSLPIYEQLFDFTETVVLIWEALAHGSAVHQLTMESQVRAYIRSADMFWSRWDGEVDPDLRSDD